MKGYKVTDDMKGIGITYEVGKTYSIDKLELNKCGFHFYEKMEHIVRYFHPDEKFVVLEVDAIGECLSMGDTTVSDKIKILRIIPREEYEEFIKFDDNNNMIYIQREPYFEDWAEYNSDGKMIHYRTSLGYEKWSEYDSDGKLIHTKDSIDREEFFKYDSDGRLIYLDGGHKRFWIEYDSEGNEIHLKYTDGTPRNNFEEWNEYDFDGKIIHRKVKSDCRKENPVRECWYEYDSDGNKNRVKYSDGEDYNFEYDEKGNIISCKELSSGLEWNVTIE